METRKIIYFDSETIGNMLQEKNRGIRDVRTETLVSAESEGGVAAEAKVSLGVPFLQRLGFMLSGKISVSYLAQWSKRTSITSTDISEFETLKKSLDHFPSVKVFDIENSSTFFRVAGTFLRMYNGDTEDIDMKSFKDIMDSFDGYDTYRMNPDQYVRFNTQAFVSNYRRNDLLSTEMELYCLLVGEFGRGQFDFLQQVGKMENLITATKTGGTLADIIAPAEVAAASGGKPETAGDSASETTVKLYDVVYAAICTGDKNAA